jgi:hypothetical protein
VRCQERPGCGQKYLSDARYRIYVQRRAVEGAVGDNTHERNKGEQEALAARRTDAGNVLRQLHQGIQGKRTEGCDNCGQHFNSGLLVIWCCAPLRLPKRYASLILP